MWRQYDSIVNEVYQCVNYSLHDFTGEMRRIFVAFSDRQGRLLILNWMCLLNSIGGDLIGAKLMFIRVVMVNWSLDVQWVIMRTEAEDRIRNSV